MLTRAVGHHDMWACAMCTFDNSAAFIHCEMCFAQRESRQERRMARVAYESLPQAERLSPPRALVVQQQVSSRFRRFVDKVRRWAGHPVVKEGGETPVCITDGGQ